MAKRLAITIAGAVSLGSYEAGVLFEVVAALAAHNAALEKAASEGVPLLGEPITIDVLTGASAGGMTAAITAQKLLFEADQLRDPARNALHSAWVVDATIESFLRLRSDEQPLDSILSSTAVDEISRKYLTQRYESSPSAPPSKRPASRHPAAASRIHLGVALSNLNGVGFDLPLRPNGEFGYTRHKDDFRVVLDGDASDDPAIWEGIRSAAVACGAFPFAFRVREIARDRKWFPQGRLRVWPKNPAPFAYTDGGVFQNEPLGLAKSFVDEIDGHLNTDSRFYLFVSPGGHTSDEDLKFAAKEATLYRTAGRLVGAVMDQAQFHDWIMAEKMNERIATFDAVAMNLHHALLSGTLQATNVAPLTSAVIVLMYPATDPASGAALGSSRARLGSQYSTGYLALSAGPGKDIADLWIDSILVLENAAALGQHDEMAIYAVTASQAELASTGLHAFQGFFSQEYRQHDYNVGRKKARDVIALINEREDLLGPIHYSPKDVIEIRAELNGLTLDKVDRGLREAVYKRVRERLNDTMVAMGLNPIERIAANNLVLPKLLKKVLAL